MARRYRRVNYFYTTVKDRPGAAYKVLSELSSKEVSLLAFNAVPLGADHAQLTLFPEHDEGLLAAAERIGLVLDGPHSALLVQGDDRLGALAEVHARLFEAGVNIFSSNGVTDGKGSYGYVIYVRPDEFEAAAAALNT